MSILLQFSLRCTKNNTNCNYEENSIIDWVISINIYECKYDLLPLGAFLLSKVIILTFRRIGCVLSVVTHRRIIPAIVVTQAHLSVCTTGVRVQCVCVRSDETKHFSCSSSTWTQHTYVSLAAANWLVVRGYHLFHTLWKASNIQHTIWEKNKYRLVVKKKSKDKIHTPNAWWTNAKRRRKKTIRFVTERRIWLSWASQPKSNLFAQNPYYYTVRLSEWDSNCTQTILIFFLFWWGLCEMGLTSAICVKIF